MPPCLMVEFEEAVLEQMELPVTRCGAAIDLNQMVIRSLLAIMADMSGEAYAWRIGKCEARLPVGKRFGRR